MLICVINIRCAAHNPPKGRTDCLLWRVGSADSMQTSAIQGPILLLRATWYGHTIPVTEQDGLYPEADPDISAQHRPSAGSSHCRAPCQNVWGSVGCALQFLSAQSCFLSLLLGVDPYETSNTPNSILASLPETQQAVMKTQMIVVCFLTFFAYDKIIYLNYSYLQSSQLPAVLGKQFQNFFLKYCL